MRATKGYQICTYCVMDTSDPSIVFDDRGVCDHCLTFERQIRPWLADTARRRAELDRLLARIREAGKGREFDCLIGVSGGVDSSYLSFVAKTEFGLRPLLFHVDTGWNSRESVHNIERLVDGLGLDLYTEVIDWEEMRDLQLAFFKAGVPHVDTPQDHAIFAAMYRFADEHHVKFILTGANYATECIRNPIDWMYYQSDVTQLRDIHRRYGTRPLVRFPTTNILWHKVILPYVKQVKVVRPLNYVGYRKSEAMKILRDKLGWNPYPQKHFESRFTRFYEGFWLYKRFGYDVRRVQYSSLILTGQMTRDEALEALRHPPLDDATAEQELKYVANKLNISVEELRSYLEGPRRSYRDYRSQACLYHLGAYVLRLLGVERGGKR